MNVSRALHAIGYALKIRSLRDVYINDSLSRTHAQFADIDRSFLPFERMTGKQSAPVPMSIVKGIARHAKLVNKESRRRVLALSASPSV